MLTLVEPPIVDLEYQLLEAARSGDLDLVVKILNQRPDVVNCRDINGRHSTPVGKIFMYSSLR